MKNTITKTTIYNTIITVFENGSTEGVSDELIAAVLDRMDKDIELASKKSSSSSKAQAEKDAKNEAIQDAIYDVLTKNGEMVYKDFIKAVQTQFPNDDLSPQKITANVTKLKGDITKYEKGKGKEKKLYINLVEFGTITAEPVAEETEPVAEETVTAEPVAE